MKKHILSLLLALFLSLPLAAKESSNWVPYKLEAAGLTVSFPKKPEVKEADRDSGTTTSVTAQKDGVTYSLVHSTQKEDVPEKEKSNFLLGTLEVFVGTYKAEIKEQYELNTDTTKGYELKLIMQNGNHVYYRIFLKEKNLISLYVMKEKNFPSKKQVSEFFDSMDW